MEHFEYYRAPSSEEVTLATTTDGMDSSVFFQLNFGYQVVLLRYPSIEPLLKTKVLDVDRVVCEDVLLSAKY